MDPVPRRGRRPARHLESDDVTQQKLPAAATLSLGHRQHSRERTGAHMEGPLQMRVIPVEPTNRQTVQKRRVPGREPLTGRQNRARTPNDTPHSLQSPPAGYRNRRVGRHQRQPETVESQRLAALDHRRRYVLERQPGDPSTRLFSQGGGGSLPGLAIHTSLLFENDHLLHLFHVPAVGTSCNPGDPYASGQCDRRPEGKDPATAVPIRSSETPVAPPDGANNWPNPLGLHEDQSQSR